MANNGTLKLQEDGTYKGEFHSLQHRFPLQMRENESSNPKAPTYRLYSGPTALGAAWENVSEATGTVYYTVQLKDPSFGTLYLKLFQDREEGGTYNIVFD